MYNGNMYIHVSIYSYTCIIRVHCNCTHVHVYIHYDTCRMLTHDKTSHHVYTCMYMYMYNGCKYNVLKCT